MTEQKNVREPVSAYTSKGTASGVTYLYNEGKNKYYAFQHVPYAQVPVGDLRFADPQDIRTFEDLQHLELDKTTNRYGPEDYLFLHIYTPELPSENSDENYIRPVIVFVPSDELEKSEHVYGPEFLMAEDVVLVVLSYRKDILGFAGFPTPNAELNISGYAGILDIIKGFDFVKKEIRNFGGCPDNITAYGQGFSCAYIRLLTTTTDFPGKGKHFHKMILSSSMEHSKESWRPPSYDLWRVANNGATNPENGKFENEKSCAEFLRKMPIHHLMLHSKPMSQLPIGGYVNLNNLLELEGDIYEMQMPVLIGFNSMESLIEQMIRPSGRGLLLLDLTKAFNTCQEVDQATDQARKFYTQFSVKPNKSYDMRWEMMLTDIKYVIGTICLATNLAKEMNPENVYLYKFSADSRLNSTRNRYDGKFYSGAAHGDELGYIFKHHNVKPVRKGSDEEKVVKQMNRIWANFARTGDPNPVEFTKAVWKPIGEQLTHYFEINCNKAIYREFSADEKRRLCFWEDVYRIKFFSIPHSDPTRIRHTL